MNILVVGCGGREHAIVKALSNSEISHRIYCAGPWINPGISQVCAEYLVTEINSNENIKDIIEFAKDCNLAIIGPEKALELGIADMLESSGIKCFGPKKKYAQLETSKGYCRKLLQKYGLSDYLPKYVGILSSCDRNITNKILEKWGKNPQEIVVKPDGLTSGKGVKVGGIDFCCTKEYFEICNELLDNNEDFVIEERLSGDEFSLMSFCDGIRLQHMPIVQDFKRRHKHNLGPNTGGMGSMSCENHLLPFLSISDRQIAETINTKVIEAISFENNAFDYKGVLYGSFIKTPTNEIKIIEYNVRFGDPEGINVLHILNEDFLRVCLRVVHGALLQPVSFKHTNTLLRYLVPKGYGTVDCSKNEPFNLIDETTSSCILAGCKVIGDVKQSLVTTGSRICAIVCSGNDLGALNDMVSARTSLLKMNNSAKLSFRSDIRHNILGIPGDCQCNTHININNDNGKSVTKSMEKSNLIWKDWQKMSGVILGDRWENSLSYKKTGVDIEKGNQAVSEMKDAVRSTYNKHVIGSIGDFGGMYALDDDTILINSIDGVGSKTDAVTELIGKEKGLRSLGHDLVNHCVNDILVMGCIEPIFFSDYIATPKLNPADIVSFVTGVAEACKSVGCVLISGETAEMPNTYQQSKFDVVGNIVGKLSKKQIFKPKETITAGDIVIGLPSSGFHTNGYTLLNKIIDIDESFGVEYAEYLSNAHRCYLGDIKELLAANIEIKGLCHITGGGLIDNPERILPENCKMKLDYKSWTWPPIYDKIRKYVNDEFDILRTFNCGIGMIIVTEHENAAKILEQNKQAKIIGKILNKK